MPLRLWLLGVLILFATGCRSERYGVCGQQVVAPPELKFAPYTTRYSIIYKAPLEPSPSEQCYPLCIEQCDPLWIPEPRPSRAATRHKP